MLGRTVLFGLLILVAATCGIIPAYALSKNPPPWKQVCYEIVGRDSNGAWHDVFLYHRQTAKGLAAAWIAEGWTGVKLGSC